MSLKNAAAMNTSSTGTGTLTLNAALGGFQSFAAAGAIDGETIPYAIQDAANTWELGYGTYTVSGTTLARTTIKASSNSGGPINVTAAATIYSAALADTLASRVYQAFLSNSSVNTTFTVTGGYTPGQIDVYNNGVHLANTEYTATNGSTIILGVAGLDGSIIEVVGWMALSMPPTSQRIYQTFLSNSSVNTTFTIGGGYTVGQVDVYINGVHLANTEYTATDGSTIVLSVAALDQDIVEVAGYTGLAAAAFSQRIYQSNTANSSVNTTFGITGGYTPGQVDVYLNGVHLANTEYTATDGSNIVLNTATLVGSVFEVIGYKAFVAAVNIAGSNQQVQFNDSGVFGASAGLTFDKVANNLTMANTFFLGANVSINTTTLFIGNSTANLIGNSTSIEITNSTSKFHKDPGGFSIGNSTANNFGNSTIEILANSSGQTVSTPISISMGNSTANTFANSIIDMVSNSLAQTVITPVSMSLGNSVANSFVNSITWILANSTTQSNTTVLPGVITMGNTIVNSSSNSTVHSIANSSANAQMGIGTLILQGTGSNVGLSVGTATKASNGATFLPNGFLLQWVRGITGAAPGTTRYTWPVTFTNIYQVSATAIMAAQTANFVSVFNANTTGCNVCANLACNVSVIAIGN